MITDTFVPTSSTEHSCGQVPGAPYLHVFDTTRIPPHDYVRCICGAVTWLGMCREAWERFITERGGE